MAASESPNPIDLQVGDRIRTRRKHLGVSQESLAEKLGLTFQQDQKYERGANRISASKLFLTCRALAVGIDYFFEGLPGGLDHLPFDGGELRDFAQTEEARELAAAFPKIASAKVRRRVLEIVRVATEEAN